MSCQSTAIVVVVIEPHHIHVLFGPRIAVVSPSQTTTITATTGCQHAHQWRSNRVQGRSGGGSILPSNLLRNDSDGTHVTTTTTTTSIAIVVDGLRLLLLLLRRTRRLEI